MSRVIRFGSIVAWAVLLAGCEAFQEVVRVAVPPPDQTTPAGTVRLFKQAVDSSDVGHAVEYFCARTGRPMLALERYEYGDELQRYMNRIRGRGMRIGDGAGSRVAGDTSAVVNAEFDWLFTWRFTTRRIGTRWYISEIQEELP